MAGNDQQARKVARVLTQVIRVAGGDPLKVTDGHIRKIVGHSEANATIHVSFAQVKAALAARKAGTTVRVPSRTKAEKQNKLRAAAEEAFIMTGNRAPKGAQMVALAKKHGFSQSQIMGAIQKLATDKGMKLITSKHRTQPTSTVKLRKREAQRGFARRI